MKKILSLFLLTLFCFSTFACLIDEGGIKKIVTNVLVFRFPNMSPQTQQQVVTNLNNNATTLSTNTNLSNQSINAITNGIVNNAPQQVLTNENTMQNTTTAIANATNNASAVGFDDLQVTNVSGSGTDGVSVTMQQTNSSGGTYTVQVDTSSTTPQNAATGTSGTSNTVSTSNAVGYVYQPRATVSTGTSSTTNSSGQTVRTVATTAVSNTNNSVSNGTTDLLTGQATTGTSSTTGGAAIIGTQVIDQNGQSSFVGGGVTIGQNTNTTYSSNPTITTQSTITFALPNGTTRKVTVAAGGMQVVQKTTTNITRADGTTVTFDTIGQPIVNMNLTTANVKRIVVNNQVLQGRQIVVSQYPQPNGNILIRIDDQFVSVQPNAIGEITNHTVYVMNGVPSVYQFQEGDRTGSTNVCTYYVNGVDTGVVANMAQMVTITLSETNSTIVGTQITTREIDGVRYYVVDGLLTNHICNQNDRIVTTCRPIDDAAMNTQNVQTITNVVVKNSSGNTLLNSNNLGQKVVQTVNLANGQTITGTIGKTNATRISYNGNQYIGLVVTAQNNVLYLDGQSTGIPVDAQGTTTQSVQIYVVDGRTTTHVVNSSDVEVSTTYYTDNGALTNIVVDPTHQIISNTTTNNGSNVTSEQTYTIRTNNGQTYTTNNINQINNGTVVRDSNGNVVISGNNIGTTTRTVLYHSNGTRLGLNSNATYTNSQSYDLGKIVSASVNNYQNTNITFRNSYYVPKYNGCYFVADGRLIQNNKNGSTVHVDTNNNTYKMVQQPLAYTNGKVIRFGISMSDTYYSMTQPLPTNILSSNGNAASYYWSGTATLDQVKFFPTCARLSSSTYRQVSCGNGVSGKRKDTAGSRSYSGIGLGISLEGKLVPSYNSGTIDTSTDWEQVQMINSNYFVAMKNNGSLYLVYMISRTQGTVAQLNLTGYSTIASCSTGSNYLYGVKNGRLYKVYINPSTSEITQTNLNISNVSKIVAGNTICVALDSTNNKVYVVDGNNYNTYSSTSNFNIRDIGVSRNEALIVGYQSVTTVASVTINGVQYNPTDVTTRTQTVYTRNGVATDVLYNANHTRTQNEIAYSFTDIESNRTITVSSNHQVSSVDYQCVSTTQSGSVSSIVTLNTNTETGIKTYAINGCDTGIQFNIGTDLTTTSRQVYYIGDVNTNVTVTPNDNLQLRGDYWTINGYNTQVRFYGLGQMAVQVADVTPGELDQDEQTTGSTVVVPLSIKAQIVRFNEARPITQIRLQFKRLTDNQWTNLKVLTNSNRRLQTRRLEAVFGRYVNVPVSKQESFILRCNITDGNQSTVTASALQPQQGNIFYWAFIRSNYDRPN